MGSSGTLGAIADEKVTRGSIIGNLVHYET